MSKSTPQKSLVLEIQASAIDSNIDIGALLRKVKVATIKLEQQKAATWITNELDGYTCSFDDLPDYRQTHGVLKAMNPYHGLVPIIIQDEKTEELLTRAPMTQGVGTLQSLIADHSKGDTLRYQFGAAHRNAIMELLDTRFEPKLLVAKSQIQVILNKVISMVLDWTLELEKAGVLGEGMSFSMDEKEKASPITQTIIAQNIGHVGSNSGSANVAIEQISSGNQIIDQRELNNFSDQANQAIPLLPSELQSTVGDLLQDLQSSKDASEQRSILGSLRSVLEGATGNIAAQGILQLISSFL